MGSDLVEVGDASHVGISIHAPRMGSDPGHGERRDIEGISIHAPRMGSDLDKGHVHHHPADFNPRSPDGERPHRPPSDPTRMHFNPRSPDGERPVPRTLPPRCIHFNPRSPDGERLLRNHLYITSRVFQSTLPGWGATHGRFHGRAVFAISIHAPRMGSDPPTGCDSRYTQTISIHAPRMGSDLPIRLLALPFAAFQSTLPGWGATRAVVRAVPKVAISIHAPRMGSDGAAPRPDHTSMNFNPRSPDGERPSNQATPAATDSISIHAPRMGSDAIIRLAVIIRAYFNPRSPDGERLRPLYSGPYSMHHFNPRSPDGERPVGFVLA